MPPVNAVRGTNIWAINRFREDALVQLLNDLVDNERKGLGENCLHVQEALAKVVNAATKIPDGAWWQGTIWGELQEFEKLYIKWNGHEGESADAAAHRRAALRKLRSRRNKIARKVRRNQFVLQNKLDLALVKDMYDAMGSLVTSLPEMFKNLATAVARFKLGLDLDPTDGKELKTKRKH